MTCEKCGGEVQGWTCQGCGASFRENDEGSLVFACHEAPAEGAGDFGDALLALFYRHGLKVALDVSEIEALRQSALRARSSAPSADKLRIAVEALEEITDTDPDEGTSWFHERADQALAALKAEGGK